MSHNHLLDEARDRIAALLVDIYADFGPTQAVEQLLELGGIAVSRQHDPLSSDEAKLWKPTGRRARLGLCCANSAPGRIEATFQEVCEHLRVETPR